MIRLISIPILVSVLTACGPQVPATPTVDIVGTVAAQMAADMLTLTAGAVTPTPIPPSATSTPEVTSTPEITFTPEAPPAVNQPAIIENTGCWTGPGDTYTLISNIEINQRGRKKVVIIGVGTEPGWIVIRNPYFNNPCWVKLSSLEIDPNMDMAQFPPMTPGP